MRAGSEVNNLPLNKQRGRGGIRRNCSPTVQWIAGRQPRVFSTRIYLAHSSAPAGSSRGREQTFVLGFLHSFLHMGEHPERFVCFSDLNTLSHSKRNNQTSELQKGSGGTSGQIMLHSSGTASQPAHSTPATPGISTQPIQPGLSFCLLSAVTCSTPCSPCARKAWHWGTRANTSIQCWCKADGRNCAERCLYNASDLLRCSCRAFCNWLPSDQCQVQAGPAAPVTEGPKAVPRQAGCSGSRTNVKLQRSPAAGWARQGCRGRTGFWSR